MKSISKVIVYYTVRKLQRYSKDRNAKNQISSLNSQNTVVLIELSYFLSKVR